mmetsp:Transcript_8039/g.11490  ORF Transcript_8039/g.11490 Transcript_8039/m.11490 type:complete len:500 (-) Transcript_8039:61-1560(-)
MESIKAADNGEIHQQKLKGHSAAVLCLAHSSSSIVRQSRVKKGCSHTNNNTTRNKKHSTSSSSFSPSSSSASSLPCCLLSGSEDGTARLWDLRISMRASLCIVSPSSIDVSLGKDVTSVSFHPILQGSQSHNHDSTNSIVSSNPLDFTVYTTIGNNIFAYDLRMANTPILTQPTVDLTSNLDAKDEINQVVLSHLPKSSLPSSSSHTLLAAADDYGHVRLMNIMNTSIPVSSSSSTTRIIHHNESNENALATCCAFHPICHNNKAPLLASGGTDNTVRLWDTSKPHRPCSLLQFPQSDTNANQVCNPPIVHSLAFSPSGKILSAALGDGSISILALENKRMHLLRRIDNAHDAAVACVHFPTLAHYCSNSSHQQHITADDRLFLSAGNDGNLFLWDLGTHIAGEKATDPSSFLRGCTPSSSVTTTTTAPSKTNPTQDATSLMANLYLSMDMDPRVLFGIPHGNKPNWLESSKASEPVLPASLFVADTSNDITVYSLPLS